MKDKPLHHHINAELSDMTRAEKKVARAILSDYPTAGLLPVAKLAELSDVSAPTVLKFVRKLGFEKYLDFQGRLLTELSRRNSSFPEQHEDVVSCLEGHSLARNLAQSYQDNLVASLAKIPPAEFDLAIQLLSDQKSRITCTGGRFTDSLARYLALRLHELRPGVMIYNSVYNLRNDNVLDITNKDIVVVFDVWRYQKDTVEFAREASKKGAKIILITDPDFSPIASTATCVLPVAALDASSAYSNLSLSALVEILLVGVTGKLGKKAKSRVKQMMDIRLSLIHKDDD